MPDCTVAIEASLPAEPAMRLAHEYFAARLRFTALPGSEPYQQPILGITTAEDVETLRAIVRARLPKHEYEGRDYIIVIPLRGTTLAARMNEAKEAIAHVTIMDSLLPLRVGDDDEDEVPEENVAAALNAFGEDRPAVLFISLRLEQERACDREHQALLQRASAKRASVNKFGAEEKTVRARQWALDMEKVREEVEKVRAEYYAREKNYDETYARHVEAVE
ncbi:hypothetical protein B0H66DRAFT_537563 [Apodospora peruviana]|uniref:Uncharacterized protein n=1 Tax=Apodospora peruviana TaxID=516989 RepID=A0AAE0HYJ9_9PEZI|nr:hypothetical protein B0H66DRAFT_537563 [Apodospora peruviana]